MELEKELEMEPKKEGGSAPATLKQLLLKRNELTAKKDEIYRQAMEPVLPALNVINAELSSIAAQIDSAVQVAVDKYRKEKGKTYGVIRVEHDGVAIKQDVPKKVDWDQEKLAALYAAIADAGDDPAEYIKTEYKVEEKKFAAWPAGIKKKFEPARTEKPGKVKLDNLEIIEG